MTYSANLIFLVCNIFDEFDLVFVGGINCKAIVHRFTFIFNFLSILDIERATLYTLLSKLIILTLVLVLCVIMSYHRPPLSTIFLISWASSSVLPLIIILLRINLYRCSTSLWYRNQLIFIIWQQRLVHSHMRLLIIIHVFWNILVPLVLLHILFDLVII